MNTVELFEGKDGWRWRLKAGNGEILATSEAYDSKSNAQRAADSISDDLDNPEPADTAPPTVSRMIADPEPEPEDPGAGEQATGPCPGAGYRTTGEPGHLHCPICRTDFGTQLTAPNHDQPQPEPDQPVINPL